MNDIDLEALERELPGLTRIARFARSLDNIPWFANLGEPLSPGARAAAERYAAGLGFPDADLAVLVDWEDAAAAAEHGDLNAPSWEAEELMRADLTYRALDFVSDDALQIAMTLIAEKVSGPARDAMEEAGALWDVVDDGARQLAVGAAVQAAHQAALTLLAAEDPSFDAEDHPFAAKFQLFEFGRWPVAIIGSSFNLF